MIGTWTALDDYTLPSSFCTTGMIWHELNALINQTRCGKRVQPCWRGPDYSRWLKPNPLHSYQTGSVFFLFANVPEIWKYSKNEIMVSAEHLIIGPWETYKGECPGWPCLMLRLCGLEGRESMSFYMRMFLVSFFSLRQVCIHQTTGIERHKTSP